MDKVSIIPMGGVGDVTRNMYLYEYQNEILIVDCGLGFPDEGMPGVDLLIPDISYLLNTPKKIVGMILTHGHEDHIGALPFILPQLPRFPIYGSTLTAHLANEKLQEFGPGQMVTIANLHETIRLGSFSVSFARVTHSIIDATNLRIQTPAGTLYHGSDFKFDFTPVDGKPSELSKMAKWGEEGILCMLEDSLGSERPGYTMSEIAIEESFERAMRATTGKVFMTTYSSNISRLNQAIKAAAACGRKICFMGRSLMKAKEIGRALGYMQYPISLEIKPHEVRKQKGNQVLILLAGSQAQESSALVRVASGEDRDIRINKGDLVIFSADPIPGNERSVNGLIDTIAKSGGRALYSALSDALHVSGHGSQQDIKLLISLTHPQFLMPIGGTYKHMVAYRDLAVSMGYKESDVILAENGQEIVLSKNGYSMGRKIPLSNVFLDEITGEPVEHYVVVDRQKIAKEGVMIIIAEINSQTGQLSSELDVLIKGFVYDEMNIFKKKLYETLSAQFRKRQEQVSNWVFFKRAVEKEAERMLFKEKRSPLVVSVILEV